MSQEEFGRFLPQGFQAQEVSHEASQVISEIAQTLSTQAVVYTRIDKRVSVQLVGACPNLDQQTYNCDIHEQIPNACKLFRRGDFNCTSVREQHGLSAVDSHFNE
ncbi:MAG: hypothetical protein A2900_04910 [Candidatus Chisholmbacteria bacterium RIFCSPLOWO2_01_FULL_50_28]|nr:MAG: hypothetical protein A2900_04910 [Candidatus Chisholmbacteria bacterium RIFCSPLOWO2_01_FULL_50_28]